MSRKIVVLVSGEKYHVFNRGVDKREIFLDKLDYLRFYQSLAFFNTVEPTQNYRLAKSSFSKGSEKLVNILAYSLVGNHFHLIVEQTIDGGISEFMKRVSGGYTSYFNEKMKRSGGLFQGTYKKVHIATDAQYEYLFSYVNENHFVHDVHIAREVYHSSSLHYQGIINSKIISQHVPYSQTKAQQLAEAIFKRRTEHKDLIE